MSVAREFAASPAGHLQVCDAADLTKGGNFAKPKREDQLCTLRIVGAGKLTQTK
ncbi:hemin uptake protein HemP [Tateyamaria sp. SN6-1]|uniref:hemin uptake protein HemP n=1 Tax=Tateyamaria sp. SN6-1 TaxID=3092148 RepID=UPI0039F506C1